MLKTHTQADWIQRARAVLPASGFGNFDPGIVIARGQGARVSDTDGTEYVDYLIGSGPMLVGHSHPEVLDAVCAELPNGQTFFANNTRGIELAEEMVRAVPCAEQVRFVASGGEADMFAIRLARAVTSRTRVLKFEGGYHGMSAEAQMSLAPARLVNFPEAVPDSAGIPDSVRAEMLVAPFNDAEYVRSILAEHGPEVAAVIVEPLQRVIPPASGFLEALREETRKHGCLLIFDEIVTGFRLAYGGAQAQYGVIPDIATLGKVIGGGFALAAIAAPKEIMAHFDKAAVGADRWLMQLGTLSGNPIAAAAGLKTMDILRRDGQYARLRRIGETIQSMIAGHLDAHGVAHRIVGDATLFDVVFTDREVRNYRGWLAADAEANARFNAVLRSRGILKSPSKLYPCLAITDDDLAVTDAALAAAASAVAAA